MTLLFDNDVISMYQVQSASVLFKPAMSLISDGELRRKLQGYGVDVGPITNNTRRLYQKKLRSLMNEDMGIHRSSSKVGAGGVKRRREEKGEGAEDVKRPKVHSSNQKQPNLYPDLSEWVEPAPINLEGSTLPPTPGIGVPPRQASPTWTPNPRPRPSSRLAHVIPTPGIGAVSPVRTPQQANPIRTPNPRPRPSSRLHPLDSPSASSSSSHSSSPIQSSRTPSLSPPSPRPDASPVESSTSLTPSPQKPGFFNTVTKFIGSQVNQLFNKVEPRRSLKPSFGKRTNDSSGSSRGQPESPDVHLATDEDEMSLENGLAEASLLTVPSSPGAPASSIKYDWELDPTEVALCKTRDGSLCRLGKGGFGEVFKGLRDGVDEVAVKIIKLSNCSPRILTQFKAEIDLISKLRHRHIVQFYGACIQPLNFYMVTELMSNDLFSILRLPHEAERYKWSGIFGKEVLIGVASGLNYLHSRKPPVVHRDIKSPNILVMDGVAKIADVGVARTMAASDMTAQKGFTIAWAAPEVIYRRRATEKIDIWSLGVIIWEVVSGRLPKPGKLMLSDSSPQSLQTLYLLCTSDNPLERPSALQVITELKNIRE